MTETIFGPLISPWPLEQQIITVYQTWAGEYLADIERKEGLRARQIPRPPAPESYRGSLDGLAWKAERIPQITVIVETTGAPERDASADPVFNAHSIQEGRGAYIQDFEVTVVCTCESFGGAISEQAEDQARAIASYYGAMTMLLVDNPPALAADLMIISMPRLSFPDPDNRYVVQSTTQFHVYGVPVKALAAGPNTTVPKESPQYPGETEGVWGTQPAVISGSITVSDTQPL